MKLGHLDTGGPEGGGGLGGGGVVGASLRAGMIATLAMGVAAFDHAHVSVGERRDHFKDGIAVSLRDQEGRCRTPETEKVNWMGVRRA